MKMINVESSTVVSVGWENDLLVVHYTGGTYVYSNVPYKVYSELLTAQSKGKYLNENIKSNYSYCKLD